MKNRQDEILYYLYRFRFLNRNQIQTLLTHKYYNRIIIWLNELTQTQYIKRYYNPKTVTIPAIYSLGTKARKYLKNNPEFKYVKEKLLDRIWREQTLSEQFKKHCIFIADIYIELIKLTQKSSSKLNFRTKTDLYEIKDLIKPLPDAYFTIEEKDGKVKRYFLDIFDELPARMILRRRIRKYFDYYEKNIWQEKVAGDFPNIILIAPDQRFKNYLKKQILIMLENEPELNFYLSTWEEIKKQGFTSKTLEKIYLE